MFDNLFENTIAIIKYWIPKKKYINENQYRDDLLDFIRKELNKPQSLSFGPQRRINIKKEAGRGLCDIGIERQIGIELKKDFKGKAKLNRLVGQISDYRKEYQRLIVVLVGNTDNESLESLINEASDINQRNIGFGFSSVFQIKIINRSSDRIVENKATNSFSFFR